MRETGPGRDESPRRTRRPTRTRRSGRGLALLGLLFLVTACSSPTDPEPPGRSFLEGTLTEVEVGRVLMEPIPAEPCAIWFSLSDQTVIAVEAAGGSWLDGSPEALQTGRRVRVWIPEDGAIRESCPGQGDAVWIGVLLDR